MDKLGGVHFLAGELLLCLNGVALSWIAACKWIGCWFSDTSFGSGLTCRLWCFVVVSVVAFSVTTCSSNGVAGGRSHWVFWLVSARRGGPELKVSPFRVLPLWPSSSSRRGRELELSSSMAMATK
ncbi:hypothetical protein V6N12_025189 [Hibiscus sabdariffa]|uniref:Uncharacterized protein n=1 Tax=Hibiscus sabdariffa TaxID=183260 RepID=A0ABR2BLQ3_9ROSI